MAGPGRDWLGSCHREPIVGRVLIVLLVLVHFHPRQLRLRMSTGPRRPVPRRLWRRRSLLEALQAADWLTAALIPPVVLNLYAHEWSRRACTIRRVEV
jgi:hypothetical protein